MSDISFSTTRLIWRGAIAIVAAGLMSAFIASAGVFAFGLIFSGVSAIAGANGLLALTAMILLFGMFAATFYALILGLFVEWPVAFYLTKHQSGGFKWHVFLSMCFGPVIMLITTLVANLFVDYPQKMDALGALINLVPLGALGGFCSAMSWTKFVIEPLRQTNFMCLGKKE